MVRGLYENYVTDVEGRVSYNFESSVKIETYKDSSINFIKFGKRWRAKTALFTGIVVVNYRASNNKKLNIIVHINTLMNLNNVQQQLLI